MQLLRGGAIVRRCVHSRVTFPICGGGSGGLARAGGGHERFYDTRIEKVQD